jgi:hypothetical protein
MPAYDANLFDPPAAVAVVSIRDPGSGKTVHDVQMLIDSGSDVSLIPQTSIDELELEIDPNASYELQGFDGHSSLAQAVTLDVIFTKKIIRGKYVVVNSGMGILGRDVINHLAILLDGPRLSWQERNDS